MGRVESYSHIFLFISDIAVFVLKRDLNSNSLTHPSSCKLLSQYQISKLLQISDRPVSEPNLEIFQVFCQPQHAVYIETCQWLSLTDEMVERYVIWCQRCVALIAAELQQLLHVDKLA